MRMKTTHFPMIDAESRSRIIAEATTRRPIRVNSCCQISDGYRMGQDPDLYEYVFFPSGRTGVLGLTIDYEGYFLNHGDGERPSPQGLHPTMRGPESSAQEPRSDGPRYLFFRNTRAANRSEAREKGVPYCRVESALSCADCPAARKEIGVAETRITCEWQPGPPYGALFEMNVPRSGRTLAGDVEEILDMMKDAGHQGNRADAHSRYDCATGMLRRLHDRVEKIT